jgi:hypothetical protein
MASEPLEILSWATAPEHFILVCLIFLFVVSLFAQPPKAGRGCEEQVVYTKGVSNTNLCASKICVLPPFIDSLFQELPLLF